MRTSKFDVYSFDIKSQIVIKFFLSLFFPLMKFLFWSVLINIYLQIYLFYPTWDSCGSSTECPATKSRQKLNMATNRFMMKSMLQLCLFPSLISPFIALKALYLPVYPTHICLKIFAGKYSHSEQKINKNTAPKKVERPWLRLIKESSSIFYIVPPSWPNCIVKHSLHWDNRRFFIVWICEELCIFTTSSQLICYKFHLMS